MTYSLETGARDLRTSRALSLAIFFTSPIPFCISSSLVLRSLTFSPAMTEGTLFSLKYPIVRPISLYNNYLAQMTKLNPNLSLYSLLSSLILSLTSGSRLIIPAALCSLVDSGPRLADSDI